MQVVTTKVPYIVFLFFFLAATTLHAQKNPALSKQIDSLKAADDEYRVELRHADILQLNATTRKSLEKKIILTDSLNFSTIKNIFLKYDYPGYDLVGRESAHNFWLLVQHQDKHPAFQDSVAIKMKSQVDIKNASSSDYAVMIDRIKINARQLQVYGTQLQVNKDSTSYELKPVMEPERLNERRKSIGLSSVEEYIESRNAGYFDSVKKK